MFNKAKRFLAIVLSVVTLLSVAACSGVSEKGDRPEKGAETANSANGENIVRNENAEAIRADIKHKADEIIATLEVGKSYDEMPITAKKLGVERFSSVRETGNYPQRIYVDVINGQVCAEAKYWNCYLPVWYLGKNDVIQEIYYQTDKAVVPYDDVYEIDYRNLSVLYCDTGYDVWAFDEDELPYFDFTYVGTEYLDDFGDTLVFEAIYGLDYNKYNIDPETGFWVKYTCKSGVETVGDNIQYDFLVKDIVIEPDYYVPDFENNVVDYSCYNGFSTLEKAEKEWLEAVKNKDLAALAAMIPQSYEVHNEFYDSLGGATPKQWCSIFAAGEVSHVYYQAEKRGITGEQIQLELLEEQTLGGNLDGYSDVEDVVFRIYAVRGTDEEVCLSVCFVKEKGRGWSVFAEG